MKTRTLILTVGATLAFMASSAHAAGTANTVGRNYLSTHASDRSGTANTVGRNYLSTHASDRDIHRGS
jgi:hypothetical protein